MKSQRTRRSAIAVGIAVLLVSIVSLACDTGPGASEPGRVTEAVNEQFHFIKGQDNIIRLDTRSGETWRTAISGDGSWIRFGAARSDGGLPPRPGRYSLSPSAATAGRAPRGVPTQVRLILVDQDSGRSWLALDTPDAEWALVGEGQMSADDVASSSAARPRADHDTAGSNVATGDAPAATLSFEGIEFTVPSEKADVSPQQAAEDVAVLIQTLEKEGLPTSMRVWAIGQLGRYPGEYSVAPLLEVLEHDDPAQVAAAVEALAKIGDPSTIPQILRLQDHPSPLVQQAVRIHVSEVQ